MTNTNCFNCGLPNPSVAASCARCGLRLRARAPEQAYRASTHNELFDTAPASSPVSAPELMTGFSFTPFQTVGDVLGPTLQLYRTNFLMIAKLVCVVAVLLVAGQYALLAQRLGPSLWLWLKALDMACEALLAGALVYGVAGVLQTGVEPPLRDCFAWSLRKWGKVFSCSVLYTIVTCLGFAVLVVPGIIFAVMYGLYVPVATIEDRSPWPTFDRSARLTQGRRWMVFATQFVLGVIVILVSLLTTESITVSASARNSVFLLVVKAFMTKLLASSSVVLALFIYLGILAAQRPLDADAPAEFGTARTEF